MFEQGAWTRRRKGPGNAFGLLCQKEDLRFFLNIHVLFLHPRDRRVINIKENRFVGIYMCHVYFAYHDFSNKRRLKIYVGDINMKQIDKDI